MKRFYLSFIMLLFIVIFSAGARAEVKASNNEVAGFILQNFSDPTVQGSILRSEGAQFETTVEGIKLKYGYLGSSQPKEALKPAESQALEALRRRELENLTAAETPEFVFSRNIKDGYAVRYAGKTIRLKHAGGSADASFEPSALVYKNAYTDTDILYFLGEGACQEMILLRSEKSPAKFVYECKLEPGGEIEVSEKGEITAGGLALSRPVIFDSSGKKIEGRYEKAGGGIVLAFNPEGLKYPILIDPTWRTTGSMSAGRTYHTATLLPDGKVLIAGGASDSGVLSSAELYDPSSGIFTSAGPMSAKRYHHTATLLSDGNVLVAGGYNGSNYFSSAEVYDPTAGTFSPTNGYMINARRYHTATLLPNGKVLIAGGEGVGVVYLSGAEVYDPTAGTFTSTGLMSNAKRSHTATLLPNGKVLIAGGYNSGGYLSSAEVYDPTAGTFSSTGSMSTLKMYHTATLLPNGKVLIAAGYNSGGRLSSAEVYDPSLGTFTSTGSMSTASRYPTATLLPNGKVLLVGGEGDGVLYLSRAEVYDPSAGTFTSTGSMSAIRGHQTATLLPDGKVLIAGGYNGSKCLSSAEAYNPSSGTFTYTGFMSTARYCHTATLLSNGKVLVAGGGATLLNGYLSSAELYDPSAQTFSSTCSLITGRQEHTATLLPNGKVLIAGGYNSSGYLSSAEVYNPTSGSFSSTGPLINARRYHTATLLPDGKVLMAGGYNSGGYPSVVELYDPYSGTFTSTGSILKARYWHTATLLPNGKVLIVGGYGSGYLSSAELYDPLAGTFTYTGSMSTARYSHSATLLPNGKVLIAGGYNGSVSITGAELYDPSSGTFTSTGSMSAARRSHSATLLPNGKIVIVGGYGSVYLSSAELVRYTEYDYTSYEATMRPSISTFPSSVLRGQTYALTGSRFKGSSEASGGNSMVNSPTNYPRVYLQFMDSGGSADMGPSGQLMDVSSSEYPIADWQNAETSISFKTPADLPAGYYLLTVMASAVPSDAKITVCSTETLPPPPPPSAPTGFIGTAESDLSIRWSWSNVTGEDGYYLHDASNAVKGATAANVTTTVETGLSANTQYTRHVNAYNSGGSAESGSYSRYTWASVPTGLATIELTSSSVKLSWAGNGTRYAVERATQEAGPWTYIATWENGITTTEYTDTGLASSTIYWYRSRAYNADQVAGSPCSAISATTLAAASSYTTKVGSNEEWIWRKAATGEAIPSGTLLDWQWRTWNSGSGRKVPSGEAHDWKWGEE